MTVDALAGKLLVASPVLVDPNFHRAVVLVLDHNDDGALGVVLNRPSTAPVREPLPAWADAVTEPSVVFVGGPVQQTAALGLGHRGSGLTGEGLRVLGGTVGTIDLDADPATLGLGAARVFAGYAGWGGGQLELELSTGSWLVLDALPEDIFTDEPEVLWPQVLRRQHGELAFLSLFPEDPSLN